MSISSRARKTHGRPGKSQIYRQGFVNLVHHLLAAGYLRLERTLLRDQEEPAITGFLVREIRKYIESPEAPKWAHSFAVHDDPPIDFPGTAGKLRPRVDIEMERIQPGPRPRFQFEAKRLYTGTSVSEYLGKNGLRNFLSGRYAAEHEDAGMLGYVQTQPVHDWVARIEKRMEDNHKELLLDDVTGGAWQRRTDPGLESSFSSLHRRPGKSILIHHTFLTCC
jgi:hypothetical protein